jgi:hypothetical protein
MKYYNNENGTEFQDYMNEVLNLIVNIIYIIIVNFEVVIYNYFAPMMVIVIQMIGYYEQEKKK